MDVLDNLSEAHLCLFVAFAKVKILKKIQISASPLTVFFCLPGSVSVFCLYRREDADQRQVPGGLHRPPAAGAGERVSLQQIHHHQEEGGARHNAQPIRETGTPTRTLVIDHFTALLLDLILSKLEVQQFILDSEEDLYTQSI